MDFYFSCMFIELKQKTVLIFVKNLMVWQMLISQTRNNDGFPLKIICLKQCNEWKSFLFFLTGCQTLVYHNQFYLVYTRNNNVEQSTDISYVMLKSEIKWNEKIKRHRSSDTELSRKHLVFKVPIPWHRRPS